MNKEQDKLITACIEGDGTAIEQFVQEYQLGVFRLTLSVLGDPSEANEATQDTFIAALKALKSYRATSSLKAWLYTVALNTSRSRLRKRKALERLQKTLTSLFHVQAQRQPTLEETLIEDEKDAVLWKSVESLDEKHRLPIVLRYYHGFSVREIADILKVKEGTVHSRLSIARDKLRAELEGLYQASGEFIDVDE